MSVIGTRANPQPELTLNEIAYRTGGKVRGDHVACPSPLSSSAGPRWKRNRKSVGVWPKPDGGIAIQVWTNDDVMTVKRELERMLGIVWQPTRRRRLHARPAVKAPPSSLYVRQVRRCLSQRPTFAAFALLLNEHRRAGGSQDQARLYARELGFTADDVARCYAKPPRYFSADEKARVLGITYERRMALRPATADCRCRASRRAARPRPAGFPPRLCVSRRA
jgi:hypothetical protein